MSYQGGFTVAEKPKSQKDCMNQSKLFSGRNRENLSGGLIKGCPIGWGLNTGFPVGGSVWGGLETGVILMEEVYHGDSLGVYSLSLSVRTPSALGLQLRWIPVLPAASMFAYCRHAS